MFSIICIVASFSWSLFIVYVMFDVIRLCEINETMLRYTEQPWQLHEIRRQHYYNALINSGVQNELAEKTTNKDYPAITSVDRRDNE